MDAKQMALDSVLHAWDVARATGGDEVLDPQPVEFANAELDRSVPDWREAGAFGPETSPSDASAQARMLAFAGR